MRNLSKIFERIEIFFFKKYSFAAKLSFYIILLTALLFIGSILIVSFYSHKLIRDEAIRNAFNQLKSVNLEIDNVLIGVSVAVDNLSDEVRREALSINNRDKLFEITKKIVSQNPHIIGSCIALEPYYYPDTKYFSPYSFKVSKDSINTSQVGNDDYDYQYMDWYQIPKLKGTPYWTDPFYDEGAGNIIMCTYSHPIFDDKGNFIGVVTADLPIEWFTKMVNEIKPYKGSYNIMIGKGGAYIVHRKSERILNETIFTATMDMADTTVKHLGKEMLARKTGMQTLMNDDTLSFVFYAPVPSSGWSLAMVCPHRDVYAGVITMRTTLIIVAIIALFLIFFLSRNIISKLTKPLSLFASSARMIAKGDFNTPLPEIKSEDEMKELYNSFSYMQTSLKNYIEELKSTTSAKERIESELSIAREIQMGMIPKIFPAFPERNDIDIFAILHPAKEVGGDLYDFFINEEKLFFTIGDVSGKGVPASLFMAVTRSLFRSVAANIIDPKIIVESMNSAISETNEANMFVTLFVGVLDLRTGDMQFCNAGHNPPCIITKDGNVSFMEIHPNLPVGLFEKFQYDTQSIHLESGTTLFLYTDGLTEAENNNKELFSENNLLKTLQNEAVTDAETLVRNVYNSVEQHVNNAVQSDDLTMLVVKYCLPPEGDLYKGAHRLVIKNQVSDLNILAEFIEKIGNDLSLETSLVMNLNLALEEAVSNVIFYAYPGGESNTIEILFVKRGRDIIFTIRDSGIPFDPTAKEDVDITLNVQERGIGGLGIFMVKQIMDSVLYSREGNLNVLKLTKKLK